MGHLERPNVQVRWEGRRMWMKLPAAKHTKKASVGVDIVTATDIPHKIQQWVHKACYNANTDSYLHSTHLPRDALAHTSNNHMLSRTVKLSFALKLRKVRFGSVLVLVKR